MDHLITPFPEQPPQSVDRYLDGLNASLRRQPSRIIGEVMGLQLYPGRSYLFFSLKDKDSGAVLKCMMWKTDYSLSGVELQEGLEVIVTGVPEIYKPSGSLTFKPKTVELVGEGALKMAYDKLRKALELEGLFAEAKKRALPEFPTTIGVVTSRDGAVIHDFMTNLQRSGYKILLIHSRVEGQLATAELLASIRTFRSKPIDVLVVIRGGGSLESLLPFNNEALVRELATFPVPVIAGIGHDKDVPLAALVADMMASTPTAVTALLNASWQAARHSVRLSENRLLGAFRTALLHAQGEILELQSDVRDGFRSVFDSFEEMERAVAGGMASVRNAILQAKKDADRLLVDAMRDMRAGILRYRQETALYEGTLSANDPMRQLRLGYSIVRSGGKVLRNAKDAKVGGDVEIRLADGTLETKIITISKE